VSVVEVCSLLTPSLTITSAMGAGLERSGLAAPTGSGNTTIVRCVGFNVLNNIKVKPYTLSSNDSAYGSSPAPILSPGQTGWSHTATSAATPRHTTNYSNQHVGTHSQPAGHLFHQSRYSAGSSGKGRAPSGSGYGHGNNAPKPRFPKGQGAEVYGQYNAKLGNTPGNLHYEEVDPCMFITMPFP
jgi:hypothetical protein